MIKHLIFLLFFPISIFCQDIWTLDKCIDYSLENNLTLKSFVLDVQISENRVQKSNFNYLPTVNGNANHGYNWGQSIDPFTNKFAASQVRTNSFYLSSNVILFSGMQRYYLQEKSKSVYLNEQFNLEVKSRNLKMDITSNYLQVVLNKKSIEIAERQLQLSQKQKERIAEFVKFEKLTSFDLLEIESQVAQDQMQLTRVENDYKTSVLFLKQNLNLSSQVDFQIDTTLFLQPILFDSLTIENLPEIKSSKQELESAIITLHQLKGKVYPTLSLFSYLGTGYSGNNKEMINGVMVPKLFRQQLNDNLYQSISLSLSIPIFNRMSNYSDIQLSKIEIEKKKLEVESSLFDFKSKIDQLILEIQLSESQQELMEISYSSLLKAFEVTTAKFEQGIITIYNFNEAKTKLFQMENEMIQSKFQTVFKKKILSLYVD